MCELECVIQIVCLVFVLISFPVYVVFIWMLIKKRSDNEFRKPFYRFCVVLGVLDLVTVAHYYLLRRTAYWGLLVPLHVAGGEWLLRYQAFVVLGSHRCQKFLVLAITLNRYSGITRPFTAHSRWTPTFTTMSWIICLVVGYGSSVNLAFCSITPDPGVETPNPEASGLAIPWGNKCWRVTPVSAMLVSLGLSVLFIVLYAHMFFVSYQRGKELTKSNKANAAAALASERMSRNYALVGCALSSLIVCYALQFVAVGVYPQFYDMAARRALGDLTWALFCMANPWLVLLCARKPRKAFFSFVGVNGPTATA